MVVREFEVIPLGDKSRLKRCQLKWNRLVYQLLFRKGACSGRPDFRDLQKSDLMAKMRGFAP